MLLAISSMILGSLVTLGLSLALARHLGQARGLSAPRWVAVGLIASGIASGEAVHAAMSDVPQSRIELTSGLIVAQGYREGYRSIVSGRSVEHPERWFLRIGHAVPSAIGTSVSSFRTTGETPVHTNLAGNPAATIRASVGGLDAAPIQVCTGDCAGLELIPSEALAGSEGVVIADWRRVQGSAIGQKALGPRVVPGEMSPLPMGRWSLTIGFALTATLIGIPLISIRRRKTPQKPLLASRTARRRGSEASP